MSKKCKNKELFFTISSSSGFEEKNTKQNPVEIKKGFVSNILYLDI